MRKRLNILLCILIMILALNACGNSEHLEETSMETESDSSESTEETRGVRMTREYIIEHGLATEEELEGVDIDRMILDGDWTEGIEEEYNIALMIIGLKKEYLFEDDRLDYTWLVSATEQEEEFLKEDIDRIKVIGFEHKAGNDPTISMIFDLEEQKAYDGIYFSRKHKYYPTKEITLTDEQINEIRELMRNCAIDEWGTRYEGTNGYSTGNFWWALYYALEDGRIQYFKMQKQFLRDNPQS